MQIYLYKLRIFTYKDGKLNTPIQSPIVETVNTPIPSRVNTPVPASAVLTPTNVPTPPMSPNTVVDTQPITPNSVVQTQPTQPEFVEGSSNGSMGNNNPFTDS